MNERSRSEPPEAPTRGLRIALWTAQVLLFLIFAGGGVWKIATPREEIAEMMAWVGEVPAAFFYATAALDFLGGVGLLLPAITRVRPGLTHWAALGCAGLMVAAILFHTARGEAGDTPFNFLLLGLCCFVFWGRAFRAGCREVR